MSFSGQTALVTEASRGLGKAIARRLASEGAAVAVNYKARGGDAETVVEEIRAVKALTEAGLRFVEDLFPTADHLTLATNDEYGKGVDWLGSVYTPGHCAGPTTNTRTPRNCPRVMLRLKLVNSRPICARRCFSSSAALTPATLKLPTLGRWIWPLRSTVAR